MTTLTAAIILARYHYKSTDFDTAATADETTSLTNAEYIIDDVIDYINLIAGTSISNLSGTAGTKTTTVTNDQNAAIKLLLPLMLKDAKYKTNDNSTLGPAGVSATLNSQNPVFIEMFEKAIAKLAYTTIDPPIFVSNDPVPT